MTDVTNKRWQPSAGAVWRWGCYPGSAVPTSGVEWLSLDNDDVPLPVVRNTHLPWDHSEQRSLSTIMPKRAQGLRKQPFRFLSYRGGAHDIYFVLCSVG